MSNNTNKRLGQPRMQVRDYTDSRLRSKFHNQQLYTMAPHLFDGFVVQLHMINLKYYELAFSNARQSTTR